MNNNNSDYFHAIAREIIQGGEPDKDIYREICELSDKSASDLIPGANLLRQHYHRQQIHLCTICNAKSGKCSEDCCFCSQSIHHRSEVTRHPLLSSKSMQEKGLWAASMPINRFSLVTSGRGLNSREVKQVAEAVSGLKGRGIKTCASLGILEQQDLDRLRSAGLDRYHHNLETAPSHFSALCSTHSFDERLDMVRRAKMTGFSICCGGIFGLGETDEQILELALLLKQLDVDAVPLNFLIPVPGTPVENYELLSPLKCLKIISLFRYVLPEKLIIVCAGREKNLKQLHAMIYYAGASGVMTGDYLTTRGFSLQEDLDLLHRLALTPEAHP